MPNANITPNPPSPNLFNDLAEQVIAKLDIKTCPHVIDLVRQEVQGIEKTELPELRAASERNDAEIKARDWEVTALHEVILVLTQHQNRLRPCKNGQDFVNCMIVWARRQATENENKRTQLERESPRNDQEISTCNGEIAAFKELIQALEKHRTRLGPYESKRDKNQERSVNDLISWAQHEVQENETKLGKLRGDSLKNRQEMVAREKKITALDELMRELRKHQRRLGPCNRQDVVNCMIDWAGQRLREKESTQTQLEAESPRDVNKIDYCRKEIATLDSLIQALQQLSQRLNPHERKEDTNWEALVEGIIDQAKKKSPGNATKVAKSGVASLTDQPEPLASKEMAAAFERLLQEHKGYKDQLRTYLQDKDREDLVAKLAKALGRGKRTADHVRRATIPWPDPRYASPESLARKITVRLEAEFVDRSNQFRKTLASIFQGDPDYAEVHKPLDNYVGAREQLMTKLATVFREGLGFALRIWKDMDWPLSFGLVLYEELTELGGLRTKRREEAQKCLDELLGRNDEEVQEARKLLHGRLSRPLVEDARRGNTEDDKRKKAVEALKRCIDNPQEDTKAALDPGTKQLLIEMALEHSFRKLQPNGHSPFDTAAKGDLVGLAFSGGGIRSATFNLGVLQGLAERGLLPYFDYLSTVSGGGYIGSWFAAWLKRKGFTNVSQQLRPEWREHRNEEPPEIEFLRSYSNYLAPQPGVLSADTWALVATYIRNLLLNLTILVLGISAGLLSPRLVVVLSNAFPASDFYLNRRPTIPSGHPLLWLRTHISYHWSNLGIVLNDWPTIYLVLAVILMGIALCYSGKNLELFGLTPKRYPAYSLQRAIQWRIAIPSALSAWLGSCWLWNEEWALKWWPWWKWVSMTALLTLALWLIAWQLARRAPPPETTHAGQVLWPSMLLSAPAEGAVGGLILWGIIKLFAYWSSHHFPGEAVHFVAWGTVLVAACFGAMVAIHIGLMGVGFPDERREWWSRTAAFIALYILGWTAVFALALYGPLIVLWSRQWVSAAVTVGWLAHTLIGVFAARSSKTGEPGPLTYKGLFVKAAPLVFVVGLLTLLSCSIYKVLPHSAATSSQTTAIHVDLSSHKDSNSQSSSASIMVKKDISFHDRAEAFWRSVGTDLPTYYSMLGLIVLCGSLALLLSLRVDVNEFSGHLLYRNRLVRCYLGASHEGECHERRPNPFTGFDPDDDLFLKELAQQKDLKVGELQYTGPYPILNTALNVTHGERLAWQERRAESFVFTPRYCGFRVWPDQRPPVELRRPKPVEKNGYRPTGDYMYPGAGPYLGTAVGISGAAASPNMGYHSSSALAFLMTVFDVRLGWWAGNPRHKYTWKHSGPQLGIFYLLLELFGSANDETQYVYLSDGGHFENLGIYELVRRGCRLILACDAGEDAQYQFEDLGNAIRKCRIDLGVDIELCVKDLQPVAEKKDGPKWSPCHCSVGIIHYEMLDASKEPGLLIYLKASLTSDEPSDVLEYKNLHPTFPHDTTANQFFTESQFESYRKLGEHIVGHCGKPSFLDLIRDPSNWINRNPVDLKAYLEGMKPKPKREASQRKQNIGELAELLRGLVSTPESQGT